MSTNHLVFFYTQINSHIKNISPLARKINFCGLMRQLAAYRVRTG
ncbi:MAG: hypothetical protein Q8K98_12925 [Bacteroidota bacterium]|nr:hypothetical protein [Bacteroidota bacterium]